ncbi:hypothetical protein [Robertkochia sediminum]|uniref:hypothetical protein n=1 Tax=Robertkochia sediminum TaxID=2785326 RepID=UPI0019328123|nr:hypothetical protein [Robertkochia sediminum]MBL7471246.1 hypothetical protein [Robertkochia sediminum]
MSQSSRSETIFLGDKPASFGRSNVQLEEVDINNETYFKIAHVDNMRPFFMSIVSNSNHWMFISSNGGLTAGRKNSNFALFPYYTDDKITESAEITGSKSVFLVKKNGKTQLWEPFSIRQKGIYKTTNNLYKNAYGNKVIFEEINHDLELSFRYEWNSSTQYGFIRKATLSNTGKAAAEVRLLDGLQNLLPYGVEDALQNASSNLVDAYKKCELETDTGLGIYSLSAIIVDKAEPSEALRSNIVWSHGLENPKYLLTSLQIDAFRQGADIETEVDMRAEKGAYMLNAAVTLEPGANKEWSIIADVNKSVSDIVSLKAEIKENRELHKVILEDVEAGSEELVALVGAADGLQATADKRRITRHFANTMFNIMRGGIFDHNYQIEKSDFLPYIKKANKAVYAANKAALEAMPEVFDLKAVSMMAAETEDMDFKRLCLEYLPLKFSRRHGDPSRPWNKFSINTRNEIDGSKILDYQGNWRDIFQNWEALAHSYPEFIEGMIHKFLNATTFDGYNPYRVTKDGFDWETIEPDNPWSYIGYWGDHQIIYLLKFLEFAEDYYPKTLAQYFNRDMFVYANVPYRIKAYSEILKDPKNTIDFDEAGDKAIRTSRDEMGADGALIKDQKGGIYRVNFMEKILATVLAKVSNFIPEGGIWMNTQRPEWNDANNALVGNGVSMVTLYYLRRFLKFMEDLMERNGESSTEISEELYDFFQKVVKAFEAHNGMLEGAISDADRKSVMDLLGEAGSTYRTGVYENGFSGAKRSLDLAAVKQFAALANEWMEHSIRANKRADNLYHAYNLMTVKGDDKVAISYLPEMLEGQVAVLSSGYLSVAESIEVLDSLRNSKLYREDQNSYILYPNKELPRFMHKNTIPSNSVERSELLKQLVADGNHQVISADKDGGYHFNGYMNNVNFLKKALAELPEKYEVLVQKEEGLLAEIYEEVFNHKAFTGRSGTFFGYEGLGSIYWHMVSKLLLAVYEISERAVEEQLDKGVVEKIKAHYFAVNDGIGADKSPENYGAFPTDPYSHTPGNKGAQQPGMTGQVKEDVLSRFGELGVYVKDGLLGFNPALLKDAEFLTEGTTFNYVDLEGATRSIALEAGSLGFTCCQVPVVYKKAGSRVVKVHFASGDVKELSGMELDKETTAAVFERTGAVKALEVLL